MTPFGRRADLVPSGVRGAWLVLSLAACGPRIVSPPPGADRPRDVTTAEPLAAEGVTDAVTVLAGDEHVCALTAAGRVFCAGG